MSVELAPPVAPPAPLADGAVLEEQLPSSSLLEQTESRPSLTHSVTSGSTSADETNTNTDNNTDSQLDLELNRAVSSSAESDSLVTPVDPPSLTVHIKNSGAAGTASSPIIIHSTIDEEPELPPQSQRFENNGRPQEKKPISAVGAETQTPKKGRLNLSKSMQTLRKKKEKGSGRERASSLSEKDVPAVPPLPAASASGKPVVAPTPATAPSAASRPTRPPLQTKSSSGAFSSFLRKLTGRSTPSSSPTTEKPAGLPQQADSKSATMTKRKTMAFGTTSKPALTRLDTSSASSQGKKGPVSAQSSSTTSKLNQVTASPLPITPVQPSPAAASAPEKETDPLLIPLPPSPSVEAEPIFPVPEKTVTTTAPAQIQSGTLPKKKAEAMLSLEGFDFDEEEEAAPSKDMRAPAAAQNDLSAGAKEHLTEAKDVVRPLAPIQIPARTPSASASAAGPASATSTRTAASGTSASSNLSSSIESRLVTPTSAVSNTAPQVQVKANRQPKEIPETMHEEIKYAGSSPPRKAPIGTGLGDLGRKESKWRKSVMGLADKSVSKRQSSARPPPTSNDAYAARQAAIARNRQSCQPTLHSTASIAAASRGQMGKLSKEEQEVAETFFMA
ncbi:hypothetical protein IAU59_001123 [Kwoniella sp. CBS 9459]